MNFSLFMTLYPKIHYLHYIICFFNNQFKIYDTIDEAFCSTSIRGENDDVFLKKAGNSYQFSLYDDKWYIQSLEKNNSTEKKFWMESYVKDYMEIICNLNDYTAKKFIIEKYTENKKHLSFYIREINLEMNIELFEKIIENPSCYKKQYTSTELFHICNSYAFSILDNHVSILKNMLFLMTQESFDIHNIYQVAIKLIERKNKDSPLIMKFKSDYSIVDESDLQSKIDCFINDYHKYNDNFLSDLNKWKCAITNMFILIKQNFFFNVISNMNVYICKILNNYKVKSIFDISFENIDILISLTDENCIFSFMSITTDLNRILLIISKEKK